MLCYGKTGHDMTYPNKAALTSHTHIPHKFTSNLFYPTLSPISPAFRKLSSGSVTSSMSRLPDILILHIKRFGMTARFREKIRAKVRLLVHYHYRANPLNTQSLNTIALAHPLTHPLNALCFSPIHPLPPSSPLFL